MRKNISIYRMILCGTSAILLVPAAAQAQTESASARPASEPTQGTDNSSSTDLGDIVVTAQKREQRFNDVGVTVNVVTGEDLARAGVRSFVDVASQTPLVQMKNVNGSSITNISIRGIGVNDYTVNNNPAAGVYVDNVYLVSPAMLTFGLFDVDRVEVLKGPQGDLYGRNTTAGAVNIISRRPSSATDVRMSAGYGSYESWNFDGAVGGALSPTLNGRFAVQTVQQDSGYQTNYVNGKRVGRVNRTNGRLQLDWKPTDNLSVLFNGHLGYEHSDSMLTKVDNIFTTDEDPYVNKPYVAGASNVPLNRVKSNGASLTVDWSLADNLSLTSITAYEHLDRLYVWDLDGTRLKYLDLTENGRINQISEEMRLSYTANDFNLIAGAFYSHDNVKGRDEYDAVDLLPIFGLAGNDVLGNQYRQRTETYAGFLHGEWTFAPKWTLIGGLRYTHEHKIFDQATTFVIAGGVESTFFPRVTDTYSASNLSGKIGLNFKPNDQTLVYASVSRGFKSGGFQGHLAFDPAELAPFDDETLTAYELGFKSRLLSNLQLNAAVFNYEYHDAQFSGPLYDSPLGPVFGLDNIGNARVRGVEADIWWRPVAGLDVRLGAGAIDTKVVKSTVPGIVTGSQLANAPKVMLNGLIRYEWALSDQVRPDISISGNYQSRILFDIVRNPPEAIEGGYFLANGEIGVSLGDHWRVSVWGKNLFNKLYRTNAQNSSVGWTYFNGAPRTVGLNLSYKL
jgi:iron complex outermembrane receptor protein